MVALIGLGVSSCGSKPATQEADKPCAEQAMEQKKCGGDCCIPGLTEEQKAKINDLKTKLETETAPLKESHRAKHDEMKKLMEADPVDVAAVNALVDEMFVIKASIKKMSIASCIEASKLLTPEQKTAMKEKSGCGSHKGGCCTHQHCKKDSCCKKDAECREHKQKEGCAEKHSGCKKECVKK